MAKEHPNKQQAYLLYVEYGAETKEISHLLGISEAELKKYIKVENWKEQRQARILSPDKLVRYYYEQSEAIAQKAKDDDRLLTSQEADTLNKLAAAIQKLTKKIDASTTMTVLRNYNNFLLPLNPKLAKANIDYELSYVQGLVNVEM